MIRSGLQLEGLAQRLLAVAGDAHHLHQRRRLEHARDRLTAERRVVDHQHADQLRACSSARSFGSLDPRERGACQPVPGVAEGLAGPAPVDQVALEVAQLEARSTR